MEYDTSEVFLDNELAGTTVAAHDSDVIDLRAAGGAGRNQPRLLIKVRTSITSGGAATVAFRLLESDNSDGSSGDEVAGTVTGDIGKATLVAGYTVLDIVLPRTSKRYLVLEQENKTAALTGGAFDAMLTGAVDHSAKSLA
ncbi:MAG: Bbp16 family capsid cement protein [Halothiobacillaceae bacterium]